ncbi:D-lactate dehydrogenase [Faunimonas pinastri]|uniref:D-lactate dehydrogenase n=1 Tax=Faunimonas pinastri TaxID=1855383 RepID=A0A1H9MG67_9HYPH|nr:hydroxyacid dehydrogenase [Faunimonas pinastri]SER22648.1 D-lactate dehydrogenase [Faunimonas pinastri]
MKIVFAEAAEWERPEFEKLRGRYEVVLTGERFTPEAAARYADAEIVSSFVYSDLGAETLKSMPGLRMIATRSTGFDHVDLGYCAEHGITVSNVPDYGDHTVAEHVFALLLGCSRSLVEAVTRTRRGDFMSVDTPGFELNGKTFGVVGTGRIGRRVIEIARGFGMNIVAFDMFPNPQAAEALGFRYIDLPELLRVADVISLHVPATRDSAPLLSDAEFASMKEGAILINTARGNIVDSAALVRALNDGHIGAAGLDVLPEEPLLRDEAQIFRGAGKESDYRTLVANHALLRFPNVIVTPHSAYNTREAVSRIVATSIANILAFGSGKPQNVVSRR